MSNALDPLIPWTGTSDSRVRVVASSSFDVFFNLALEDRLFKTLHPGERLVFLWRNSPTVVVGRFQNPWLECRLAEMRAEGVGLARRQSGGGAVYHDPGNLCVTFMGPRVGFDRRQNIDLVVALLREAGVDAEANDRNDVIVGGRKVSGSAYRDCADRSFHHATLLFDADLDRLGRYLRPGPRLSEAKGTPSVRSPVANLADYAPGLGIEDFRAALAASYAPGTATVTLGEEETVADTELAATRERWSSWDWLYGACPDFVVPLVDEEGLFEVPVRRGTFQLADGGETLPYSPSRLAAELAGLAARADGREEEDRYLRLADAAAALW